MRIRSTNKRIQVSNRAKTFRFDARLNEHQKLLIQRAADLEGRSMTDFVLHSAEVAAERTIERRASLVLTARETEAFVEALLTPRKPGAPFCAVQRTTTVKRPRRGERPSFRLFR